MRCIFFKLSKPIARSGAHDLKLLFHRDGLSTGFWRGHMAWRTWSHGIFYIPCSAYLCMPCMPWMRQTLTQALTQAPQHTTTSSVCHTAAQLKDCHACCWIRRISSVRRVLTGLPCGQGVRKKYGPWEVAHASSWYYTTGSDPSWIKSTYRKTMTMQSEWTQDVNAKKYPWTNELMHHPLGCCSNLDFPRM